MDSSERSNTVVFFFLQQVTGYISNRCGIFTLWLPANIPPKVTWQVKSDGDRPPNKLRGESQPLMEFSVETQAFVPWLGD